MIPDIDDQLAVMIRRLESLVLPALPAEASFAREQLGFVLTNLAWLRQTTPVYFRYCMVEHEQYRRLLQDMAECIGRNGGKEMAMLEGRPPLPAAADAQVPLEDIAAQTREMKALVTSLYERSLDATPELHEQMKKLLASHGREQVRRERALYAGTTYVRSRDTIKALLYPTQD